MVYYNFIESPLGILLATSNIKAITGLYFDKNKPQIKPDWQNSELAIFKNLKLQLDQYFKFERKDFNLDLEFKGTEFQNKVWQNLNKLDFGKTLSYKEFCQLLELSTNYSRAVAAAISKNPISIIIPCHRVIGSNNSLTGYAGGLDRKAKLLDLEK